MSAMATDLTFCPLCGVLIDMWQGDLSDPDERFSWLAEVRAIRARRRVHEPFVTGVGWLNYHHEVIAPAEYSFHYTDHDPHQELDEYFAVHHLGYAPTAPGYWCFVVHDVCWELLRDRVDPIHQLPVDTIANHLFALLYNTPMGYHNLEPGHDFGNVAQFQDLTTHGYYTRVNASNYSFITGDPREEFQPEDEILEDAMPTLSAPFTFPETALRNTSDSDPFYLFPSEIIMAILIALPSRDVCSLRLASKYIADVSSPRLLSQRFWSSRFEDEFEMGFVYAGPFSPRPMEPADWRMLYMKAKAASNSECFPGFRSRRRICQTLLHISDALRLRLQNEEWIRNNQYSDSPASLLSTVACAEVLFFSDDSEEDKIHAQEVLPLSCRLFKRQSISWPQCPDVKSTRLRVSFIYVNGRTYISGFRVVPAEGSKSMDKSLRAGFINPRDEREIIIGPHDYIEHLEVAMTMSGLTGVRLCITGSQGSFSISIGDMKLTDPGSGIGRLTPRNNTRCIGLHLGFDACKIISISLIERQAETLPNAISKDTNDTYSPRPKLAELWNPNIPSAYPVWHFSPNPPTFFNLCLDMDFGGPNGQLLRSLVGVIAFMGPFPAVFVGLSFAYDDGSERCYGRSSSKTSVKDVRAVRQYFPIDGPAGEIMTSVKVSYSQRWNTVQAITITTNIGRTRQFRLYGKASMGDDEIVQNMQAESGTFLTSFCARIDSPSGSFRDFSTRSELLNYGLPLESTKGSLSDVHQIPINSETLISAEEMLAYPGGFAFTTAILSCLKRIRISVDDEGYPDSRAHISGIWLEYHDSKTPVILGQWYKELSSLDLDLCDRITEITSWHDYTNTYKRVKFGPIAKLKLVTARGISKEFLDPLVGGKVCLQYRENPYEKLTGLLWGCNHEWDHVRAFYTPKPNSRGTPLLAEFANNLNPTWMVQEKAFLQEICDDGSPDPVIAIEVSYKELGSEPSGITLIYESREPLTLGSRGGKPQTMTLAPGETLTRFEIGVSRGNRIELISLSTASGRKVDFSEKQDVDAANERIRDRTVYLLHPSCNDNPTPGVNLRQFPHAAGALVGFWAMPKRRDRALRYPMVGPIFERAGGGGTEEIEEALQKM
ncbi:hypothetical protein F4779DRAFT_643517 [Xylariaceae sp. FL0662B]|nr:hypothetical protein F4779DRAFT_643517 [Xylariaceae sp. FL0662B]